MSFFDSPFPSAPGIYCILNTVSGKRYIGSAVNLQKRCYEHLRMLRKGTHKNRHLQAAFNHYGEDAFTSTVIELVECKEQLIEREQFHIDTSQPEYNLVKLAGSNLGMIVSEESRRKMSEQRRGRPHAPHSAETRAKISAAKTGRPKKGHPHSAETRAKLSAAHTGKVVSEATRQKLRSINTGKKHSEVTKAKLSELGRRPNAGKFKKGAVAPNAGQFKKGQVSLNKGKPMSEEQKRKLSLAHMGKKRRPKLLDA